MWRFLSSVKEFGLHPMSYGKPLKALKQVCQSLVLLTGCPVLLVGTR